MNFNELLKELLKKIYISNDEACRTPAVSFISGRALAVKDFSRNCTCLVFFGLVELFVREEVNSLEQSDLFLDTFLHHTYPVPEATSTPQKTNFFLVQSWKPSTISVPSRFSRVYFQICIFFEDVNLYRKCVHIDFLVTVQI